MSIRGGEAHRIENMISFHMFNFNCLLMESANPKNMKTALNRARWSHREEEAKQEGITAPTTPIPSSAPRLP